MTLPTVLFGILISTLYGAAFHLWRGGNSRRLLYYLALGWLGFWIGHFAAVQFGLTFASVGALHLGMATLLSAVCLALGHWLSLIQVERK